MVLRRFSQITMSVQIFQKILKYCALNVFKQTVTYICTNFFCKLQLPDIIFSFFLYCGLSPEPHACKYSTSELQIQTILFLLWSKVSPASGSSPRHVQFSCQFLTLTFSIHLKFPQDDLNIFLLGWQLQFLST